MLSRSEFDRVGALVLQRRAGGQSGSQLVFGPVTERCLPLSELGYSYSSTWNRARCSLCPPILTQADWSSGITLPDGIIVIAPTADRPLKFGWHWHPG